MKPTKQSYTERMERNQPPLGGLRIAKVTYEHFPIYAEKNGVESIGDMIDRHIASTIEKGELVSEVSLFFETPEQQRQLAEMYAKSESAVPVY